MPKAKKIKVDQERLNEVCQRGGFTDKSEAINASLAEFIRIKRLQETFNALGKIEMDADWTPRKARGKPETPLNPRRVVCPPSNLCRI
ncbi:hypothetical protein AGMMS49959_05270 [Planctomycetales bacterium]|nr:hypothetical protein AGMMS49959_05270 [Planctomycetales bacterium]